MNAIVPLIFDGQALRVIDRDGQPWFVLADACAMLGIKNPTVAAKPLDETEKAKVFIGQGSEATVVSLPGLLTLIVRCRGALKPGTAAYRVRKWVTIDVVPTIMRTGTYGAPLAPANLDDNATLRALLMARMDKLDELQPKADALARIAEARGSSCVTDAAEALAVPPASSVPMARGAKRDLSQDRGGALGSVRAKIQSGMRKQGHVTSERLGCDIALPLTLVIGESGALYRWNYWVNRMPRFKLARLHRAIKDCPLR